jgi:single-strand DNA-binding protein
MANRCLNKVLLIGNLTRDPELRYTPEGTAVSTFGLATNRSWVTNDGQKKEEVQYHRIVAWQKLAELSAKILSKGSKVYIEGRIVYRTFTGKDGQERNVAEIIMDDFISWDNRKKSDLEDEGKIENNEKKVEKKESSQSLEENKKDEGVNQLNDEQEIPSDLSSEINQTEDVNPDDIPF